MPPRTYRHWLISALILLAGLLITGLLQLQSTQRTNFLGQQQFISDSQQIANRLQQRITEFGTLLNTTRALYSTADSVSRAELHTFIHSLAVETHYPDLVAIGYFQPQAPADMPQQIDIVRTPKGLTSMAPVIYATGHDPFNEPARGAALSASRSSGNAVLSDKLALPDPNNINKSHTGFVLYLPVYRHDCRCDDEATRLQQHIGWVHAAFRASDVLQHSTDNSDLDLVLFDGTVADDNSLAASYRQSPDHKARYSTQIAINGLGHPLSLQVYSSADYENRQSLQNSQNTAWAGTLISLLLAIGSWILMRSFKAKQQTEATADSQDDSTKTVDQQKQEHVLKVIYVGADKLLFNITLLLLLVSAGIGAFHDSALLTLIIGLPLVAIAYWLTRTQAGSLQTRCTLAAVMMLLVALQIQQSRGLIETHFAVFIVLSFLLFYRDWRPIAVGVGVITLHHILFNSLQSMGWPIYLFDHGNDFEMVAIHIAYVTFEACALIFRAIDTKQQLLEDTRLKVMVLHHSTEGFFSFDGDLTIQADASDACLGMLGVNPTGLNAAQLLFPDDEDSAELLRSITDYISNETDAELKNTMTSLLPDTCRINDNTLRMEYKPSENGHMMVFLTNINHLVELEEEIQYHKTSFNFVVSAVAEQDDFFSAVNNFEEFVNHDLHNTLNTALPPITMLNELYREIHTYKGVFKQMGFSILPEGLHALEGELDILRKQNDALELDALMDAVLEPPYLNWLNNELTVLSSMLGEKFVNSHRTMLLSEEQADGVQHLADCILQDIPIDREEPETKNLLIELVTARKGSLKEAIRSFDRFIDQAATKSNKLVNPIRISGDDVQLDTQLIRHLKDAMVHVVSNAVIHGIEPPDERLDEGKALEGTITVNLSQNNGQLQIEMVDDGAGINLDGLKRVAVTRGLYSKEQANTLDKDGLLELIFTDNVSTAAEVSQYAGRGVGLAAVRSILQKQGGNITVSTQPHKGTCFTFTVPLSPTSAKSNDREDHD